MKIALIIFRIAHSHGSLLQTYALFNILKDLGHDVTIINRKDTISKKYLIKRTIIKFIQHLKGINVDPIFYKELLPPSIMKEMSKFVKKHYTPYLQEFSKTKFKENSFDAYIVGSDQTWRPKFVQDIKYFYLDFIENFKDVKRIAYAPSFGTSEWEYSPEQTETCRRLAKRFDAISVREKGGVHLCDKYLNVKAIHVLDPTMLLDKEDYIKLLPKNPQLPNHPIISYSILDKTEYKTSLINEVSKMMNITTISLIEENRTNGFTETGVEFWLEGICKSKFVITDSFHATVFSIIMNIPFIVIANKFRGIDRIVSLLELSGLENRIVYENENKNIKELVTEEIDWISVNDKINVAKKESMNFLIKHL